MKVSSELKRQAVSVGLLIDEGRSRLAATNLPSARYDAEELLARLLGVRRLDLLIDRNRAVDPEVVEQYRSLIGRRVLHEPLQYLRAEDEFFGLSLTMRPGVFIPRPETELLVERVLSALPPRSDASRLGVDLGTGSGCIALALASARADLRLVAVDRSSAAVALARENAERLGLVDRVEFREGDLWEPIQDLRGRLDLVVSNPPYVARELMEELPLEVSGYEPSLALDGGPGGTALHGRIIREAPSFLKRGGLLAMEIGLGQGGPVTGLIEATGAFFEIQVLRDLAGIDRILMARRY